MARLARRVKVAGIVHGVLFRASMMDLAKEHGVHGWVRNLADGSVEAHLEGEERSVLVVIEWARRGPARARVDSVEVTESTLRDFKGFRIAG